MLLVLDQAFAQPPVGGGPGGPASGHLYGKLVDSTGHVESAVGGFGPDPQNVFGPVNGKAEGSPFERSYFREQWRFFGGGPSC